MGHEGASPSLSEVSRSCLVKQGTTLSCISGSPSDFLLHFPELLAPLGAPSGEGRHVQEEILDTD